MSTTVDSRVVEMKFDNRHFESNVSTTMSTLDKLKQRLNLTGASKGLENVGAAAKNIKLGGLGSAAETVGLKFNAMYTMADQALRNITNRVQQTAENMIKAFTIDPVKTGFQEYETQIGAIQTILANTQSKGTTLEDVNAALDELNAYADKTIYNFTEMTRNIGTFTAAGTDLDTSVKAIQGIANLAAVSGSTSQQASTAMYQLSQALSAGTVKLMDWNSVVNAGMGGQVFQDALKETARVHGVAIDQMIEEQGSFRETLSEGWITSEILTETLEKFTTNTESATEAEIAANREKLKSIGYTEEQIEAIFKLGNTATNAATKVKTWTQLWDTLKEAAQSGWTQTWELIIGDFEQAQALFTKISDTIGNFINKMSETRNNILGGALTSKWDQVVDKIEKAGISTEDFTDALKATAKEHGIAVDDLIEEYDGLAGAFAKGKLSGSLIAETLKNMTSGGNKASDSLDKLNKHTVVAGDTLWDLGKKYGMTWQEIYELNQDIIEDPHWIYPGEVLKLVENVNSLSDAQLKSKGYTEEQITALRKLAKEAETAGTPLNELIKDLERPSGRDMLIESLANSCKGLAAIFATIKKAWTDIFPPKSTEERSKQLYNLITRIYELSQKFELSDGTAKNLTRTFKGLFAIIDIITTITGGALKLAFKALAKVFGLVDVDVLEYTAILGDAIVKVRDWIDAHNPLVKIFQFLAPKIKTAVTAIRNWINGLKDAEDLPKAIAEGIANGFGTAFTWVINVVKNFGTSLKDGFNGVPNDVVAGLANGLWEGIKLVGQVIVELGKIIITKICDVLGIESPSTVFFAIGGFIMAGLALGLTDGAPEVWETIKTIGTKLHEMFLAIVEKIDLGKILAAGLGVGILGVSNKFADVLGAFAKPIEGVSEMFEGLGEMFSGIGRDFKASAMKKYSQALVNLMLALGILVAIVVVLSKIDLDTGALWRSVGVVAVLSVVIVALMGALMLMNQSVTKLSKEGFTTTKNPGTTLLAIAASLLLVALAVKMIADLDLDDPETTLKILAGALAGLIAIVLVMGVLAKGDRGAGMSGAGSMLLKMAVALIVMVYVVKLIDKLDSRAIFKGLAVIAVFGLFAAMLVAVSETAGEHASKAGSMMLKIAFAMLIMTGVIAIISTMSPEAIKKGLAVMAAFELLCVGLVVVSSLAGEHASKAGSMMLKMSLAFLVMAAVIKVLTTISDGDITRSLAIIAGIELIFISLVVASGAAGKNAAEAGKALLMMSVSLVILTGVLFILSKMPSEGLGRALGIVAALVLLFDTLIATTALAKGCKSTLITLIVAIGLLVGAIIALSFIDKESLSAATTALSAVMVAFAIMTAATKFAGNTKQAAATLLLMAGVIVILAFILGVMSALNVEASMKSATALSILLIAMSAAMVILNGAIFVDAGTIGTLALLGLVVAEIAIILGVMSALGVEASMNNVVALSVLLLAMSAAMVILNGAIFVNAGTIGIMALLGLVVLELGAILWVIQAMKLENTMDTVLALSVLLITMSAVLVVLGLVGGLAPLAVAGVTGLIVVLTEIGVFLAAVGWLMQEFPNLEEFIDAGIPLLEKVASGLGSVLGSFITGFAGEVLEIFPMIGKSMSDFMTEAQGFIDGARNIDEDVLTGVKTLAEAMLIITGASILDGLSRLFNNGQSSMEKFATELPLLGEGIAGFIDEVGGVDETMMSNANVAAGIITTLAEAAKKIPNTGGLLADLVGDNELGPFAEQFPVLGEGIKEFIAHMDGIDDSKIPIAKTAASIIKTLAEAANEIPNAGGLLADLVGDNELGPFASQFPVMADGIVGFINKMKDVDEGKIAIAETAAEIITTLASAAKEIPNAGGWLAAIVGDNELGTFALQFPVLGEGIVGFIDKMKDVDPNAAEVANRAAGIITTLAKAANTIPNSGGWLASIVGDNDLATFASGFPNIGAGIAGFSQALVDGGVDENGFKLVRAACAAITTLAQAAQTVEGTGDLLSSLVPSAGDFSQFGVQLPIVGTGIAGFATAVAELDNSSIVKAKNAAGVIEVLAQASATVSDAGSLLANLIGENEFATFAKELPNIGEGIADFVDEVADIGDDGVAAANTAVKIIVALTNLTDNDLDKVKSNLKDLGKGLEDLADCLSDFLDSMEDVPASKMNVALANVENAVLTVLAAKGITAGDADGLVTALSNLGSASVDALSTWTEDMGDAGTGGAEAFTDAIHSETAISDAESAARSLRKAAVQILHSEDAYTKFYKCGTYLVTGFSNGITDNTFKAEAAAAAMAEAARIAAEEALGVESPSKVFYKIGDYVGIGFVNALRDSESSSYKAGASLGDSARLGISKAIAKIRDVINSDMDTQPTIRPVLDLSEVEAGAGTIGNLLGSPRSVGVLRNVGVINSMMNQRSQNGVNGDVVSAIDKLNKKLDNLGGTTNNFNGITYDDGSNISEAVQTIVRAAKIERRV